MNASWLRRAAVPVLCVLAFAPVRGELCIEDRPSRPPSMVMMAIIDHPDPIGSDAWKLVRPQLADTALNPDGFDRGDGRPDVAWYRADNRPVVTWAYNTGADHDVAFAEWSGSSWSVTRFLTADAANEMDPRIAVADDGAVYVVWWEEGDPDRVWVAERQIAQAAWTVPVLVSEPGESGRRPSVIVHEGVLIVAYERASPLDNTTRQIVMARRADGASAFTREVVASTTRTERLDPMLHHRPGRLWVDWRDQADAFGYAVASPSLAWSPAATVPWADATWIGAEEARHHIANLMAADATSAD